MAQNVTTPSTVSDPQGDLESLEKAIGKPADSEVIKKISLHIDRVWADNQRDNKDVRLAMVGILRRVRGEYDPNKLAAIRAFQGSESYVRTGENKCRSAESWIKDIYRGDIDLPWEIEPTAVPTLPDETHEKIEDRCRQEAKAMEQQLAQNGQVASHFDLADLLNKFYERELDKENEALKKEAKDRCRRAGDVIRDQNQEGGWSTAFREFLHWFVRVKAGIIKGPVLTRRKKRIWQPKADGTGFELGTTETLVNDVYCVSPFNFFPSKGMRDNKNGDTIELHPLNRQSISELIGVPGYSEPELKAVLAKVARGELKHKWFSLEDDTIVKQVTRETGPNTQALEDREEIWAMEFYGSASGAMLMEWGVKGELDPSTEYQANAWKIGPHVIKAVINPDPLGRKPYHFSSWAKNPDSVWGEGLLEFAAPLEDALNAVLRALINNVAIASGPMCELDKDRVDVKIPIYPWRQIESTSMQMKNDGPAVSYYQPLMHGQELIAVWQFLSKVLDEMTVPAYAQGASQSGVTAGTATVFTQLLAAATRSIKGVVSNLDDDVIGPYIQMCYDQLMRFTEDESLKGDAQAVAKGVQGLLAREQQAQRKVEFLQVTANPAYSQVLGSKNIGAILAQVARSNDIVLPDMDRLEGSNEMDDLLTQMMNAQAGVDPMQQQGQMAAGGGAPQQAQGMNPDGSQAGVNNG